MLNFIPSWSHSSARILSWVAFGMLIPSEAKNLTLVGGTLLVTVSGSTDVLLRTASKTPLPWLAFSRNSTELKQDVRITYLDCLLYKKVAPFRSESHMLHCKWWAVLHYIDIVSDFLINL